MASGFFFQKETKTYEVYIKSRLKRNSKEVLY